MSLICMSYIKYTCLTRKNDGHFYLKLVKRTDAKVKCKCLEIIGALTPLDDVNAVKSATQLLHSYGHSHEPRVRTIAFKMMVS